MLLISKIIYIRYSFQVITGSIDIPAYKARANPQKSQNTAAAKKNEKPTMTAAALAPKNDSQITFAMK